MNPIIDVRDLTVARAGHTVLRGVSFSVSKGEHLALLGPNGAGKSTLLAVLATVIEPAGGEVAVLGHSLPREAGALRRRIGYLPEEPPLYPELTVLEYLSFVATVRGVYARARRDSIESALARLHLQDVRSVLCSRLSKGYRQRVGLAQALLGQPEILLLDEPLVGLDGEQAREFSEVLERASQEVTIVLTTHVLAELTAVTSRALVLQRGVVAREFSRDQFSEIALGM